MEDIHIGNEIKIVFERRGLTITEFSKRINKSRENVYSIFNRKTIDTGLLLTISEVLEFDFFTLYVKNINPTKDSEVDRLRKEIKYLEEINSLLRSKLPE